ncbi:MtrB/PioB family decaheme-associated outer membrane protein [Shewanella sp. JNE10-2]|uniref:MtrB/PioB family decaheme-associated outer membrane protein n=1 Tax=unclassified Shewanella TaxID=196818 RepID=UPI002005349A|nr:MULTISPECIES: MtrB/PioB family decaheme-associated outer membrane protein [unclassified Shewanella]MCK7631739.1 MtrB/PioB family decaheme-associated outer membrane protein [Shewanella sp. JNE9-1]MCK7647106.1 MtrB/PioB family decaheme-associated outer membrane protein [Shewanella sp. JNE3-1]MCK7654999.1 MtrB/PioB family decaheme-associated outer membrane protein [Shewanella sp. JNE4-1]UPO25702.1 MtrB/PioB family decaheme-associated outer membrane protein [Shewanella sp. JNE10-2]UPO36687.1 Mt
MKFKLNLITLALLANTGFAVAADGYGIANANTEKVKLSAWSCKGCIVETGVSGTVGVAVGYNSEDDIRSANAFGTSNEVAGKFDADLAYSGEKGYRANIDAYQLGMDGGRLDVNAGKLGQYNVNVNYRQIATYDTNNALTPYSGMGGNNLTLPSNWITAGSSSQMPLLMDNLNSLELSLKRERMGLGFAYQGESLWSTYVNYMREEKTGLKQASGSFFNQSMMLAEPVDYTTDTIEAGIKLKGDRWFTALNYNGSIFKNEYNQLNFDSAFNPTFGAQTKGSISLAPDNQSHTVSLMGQYNDNTNVVSGRLLAGQMSQDQALVTSGYGFQIPTEAVDAKVDLLGMNLKLVSKVTNSLRLSGSYDYHDRDNNTQIEEWTQISINNVNGKVAYNTPYDNRSQRFKVAADYRITQGMKLDGGYDFKRDERNYQDRETTDENTVWARFRVNSFEMWDMWVKGSYGQRDGSQYQASEWTSSETNSLLRKYNLADRDRTQVEARITHTPIDSLTIDVGARYALDDYTDTVIGLTESKDTSYDANISYMITTDLLATAFYNYQIIESEQTGSSNYSNPTWTGYIEDKVDVVGAGISYNNLLENKLRMGLDYTYSNSDSNTQVRQGITGDYGDYFAKVHNINLYAQYQATEKMAWRLDYKVENYKDNDAANDIAVDGIWNVVGFGSNSHDYTAQMIMLSMSYKL